MLTSNGIGNSTVKVGFGNNGAVDAFGRLRVSEPAYRFDSQLTYKIDTDLWDTMVSGSGGYISYDSTNRMANISGGSGVTTSVSVLQSHYCPPYTPGRSHLGFATFCLGTGTGLLQSGVSKKVGLYDYANQNGLYLEQTVSGLNFTLKGGTSYPAQIVPQTGWNIDKLDGNGPSRLILDPTKTQILFVNYQALYVGRAMMGFDIGGELVPAHQFTHANQIAYPYIKDANLPIHYSVTNASGAISGSFMNAICASVMSEGGDGLLEMDGRNFAASNGNNSVQVSATREPILSIKVSGQLNNINSNTLVVPESIEVYARTNDAFIEVVRNCNVITPTWIPVKSGESVMLYDVSSTGFAGAFAGTIIDSFFAPTSSQAKIVSERGVGGKVLLNYSHLLNSGDTLSLVASARTSTADCHGNIKWKEIR
jgi:hypothetical protein